MENSESILTILKWCLIFTNSFYLFMKFLNLKVLITREKIVQYVVMSFGLSLLVYFIKMMVTSTYMLYGILLFWLVNLFFRLVNPVLTFIASVLSFTFSFAFYTIICGVLIAVVLPFYSQTLGIEVSTCIELISGIVSLFISRACFRIKRFKKGMTFLYSRYVQKIGFGISLIGLGALFLFQSTYFVISFRGIIPFLVLYIAIFLIVFWWEYRTRQYYLRRLRQLELESLRQELEEKDAQIQKLLDNNDSLARIIHRDNKLIPAMEASVREFLTCGTETPELQKERGEALAAELDKLAQDRQGILTSYESHREGLPQTGCLAVDAMLSYMGDRAAERNIHYEVKLGKGFASGIPEVISEKDCTQLLSDLIENALIATTGREKSFVCVHLGRISELFVIEISDNGAAFDGAVYQDFGLQKHSTHLDEGGSGLGLLDIWDIKKKYAASLHIHEYEPGSTYTKKISLVFDRRGHYLIRTYRSSELSLQKMRSDLYILPLE